ncbi:MAG: hypothetical protein HY038_03505 [Nitrospirae bacterium]|nr:hypothetical protein [Nitrospirota bacterium]
MAPLTAWLPARPNQDFDLIIKIVGPAAFGLMKDWTPIAQSLIQQGFSVMAQRGRLNGELGDVVLGIRVATRPFYSMGQGCDVLVHLGGNVPEFCRFNLQPGSVLLWEPPQEQQLYPILPEGIIAYPIPLSDLCLQHGEGLPGKGFAALGVLLQLLGVPDESLRHYAPLLSAPHSFAGGVAFASHDIDKRDAYSLPLSAMEERSAMMLTPEQAILLGYAVSSCECGTACDAELIVSPVQWTAKHLGIAGSMTSVLESDRHPGVQAYRGSQGKVLALLRGNDSAIASCLNGLKAPRIFVAADIPDAFNLVIAGHDLIRSGLSDGVGILIEETIACRMQSLDVRALVDTIRRIGFVAWGAAQGVVRDAVALCRSFGLRVAALYPKRIVPFSNEDMESFAKTVGHVVLVESGHTQGYWDRLRTGFSFKPLVVTPQPGQSLTPMDIFLREGLGAV